jgi:hypothetical protein
VCSSGLCRQPRADGRRYSLLTVRRLRPFARRRLSTSRPFFVLIRTRNPWVRLRCRVFGWNVRFPFMISLRFREHEKSKLLMVANAFRRCQSEWFVLQSASFNRFLVSDPSPIGCVIWSVPKDFHTCGKNCGKSLEFKHLLRSGPQLAGFSRGEGPKTVSKRDILRLAAG